MDFWSLNKKKLLVEVYGYSKEHAGKVLSAKVSASSFVEKGLEYFEKIKKMIENAENCGAKEPIEKFKEICENLENAKSPKEIVRYASENGFTEGKYKLLTGMKEAVGIAPKAPMENGKMSLHRIGVSFRLFVCYEVLKNALLEWMSNLNTPLPKGGGISIGR